MAATWSALIVSHSPLKRRDAFIRKPAPTVCQTTVRERSREGEKRGSTLSGRYHRRASQNSISCRPHPSIIHSTGLTLPLFLWKSEYCSSPFSLRLLGLGCRQLGNVVGSTGMAPHVAAYTMKKSLWHTLSCTESLPSHL